MQDMARGFGVGQELLPSLHDRDGLGSITHNGTEDEQLVIANALTWNWPLAAGNGPYDEKGLCSRGDRIGQWGVRWIVGQILLAGEEPQERPALLCDVVTNRTAQHRVA